MKLAFRIQPTIPNLLVLLIAGPTGEAEYSLFGGFTPGDCGIGGWQR
jgi:hypothetical protein